MEEHYGKFEKIFGSIFTSGRGFLFKQDCDCLCNDGISSSFDCLIIVSYSDTAMNHHGYIYQACNFLYTGITKERTDKYTEGNKHCRHYSNDKQGEYRKVRSAKHRYVYFCTYDKKEKEDWRNALNYSVLPYPKGDNSNYELGNYLQPKLINCEK